MSRGRGGRKPSTGRPDYLPRNPRRVPHLPRWAPSAKPPTPDAILRPAVLGFADEPSVPAASARSAFSLASSPKTSTSANGRPPAESFSPPASYATLPGAPLPASFSAFGNGAGTHRGERP